MPKKINHLTYWFPKKFHMWNFCGKTKLTIYCHKIKRISYLISSNKHFQSKIKCGRKFFIERDNFVKSELSWSGKIIKTLLNFGMLQISKKWLYNCICYFWLFQIEKFKREGKMKKVFRIIEGLTITIGSMLFGYCMLYLFYFLFIYPNTLMPQEIF
jgi:hypothetical protein